VNAKDITGNTPLYNASEQGNAEVVKLLLAAGADAKTTVDYLGKIFTPLSIAQLKGHTDVIRLLKEANATIILSKPVSKDIEIEYRNAVSQVLTKRLRDIQPIIALAERYHTQPECHFILGNVYGLAILEPNHYEKAIKQFDKVLELDSDCAAAYVNRGVFVLLTAHDKWLSNPLDVIARTEPDHIPDYLKKAASDAIQDFDYAIRINPDLFAAHFNKGVTLSIVGRSTEAIVSLDKALRIAPKMQPTGKLSLRKELSVQCLGTAHPLCIMSQFRSYVIEEFFTKKDGSQKVCQLGEVHFMPSPNDFRAFAYFHKSIVYSRGVHNHSEAVNALTSAIEQNPRVPAFYLSRSISNMAIGKKDLSINDIDTFKQLMNEFRQIK